MKAIFARRSIRRYTAEAVSAKVVRALLEAAMAAPSAGDERPWQFIVLRDRAVLDAIPAIHPYAQMVKQAPVAIVVCGDLKKEKYKGYQVSRRGCRERAQGPQPRLRAAEPHRDDQPPLQAVNRCSRRRASPGRCSTR